ncbi:MAG: queuosine precursor transporter [Clostridia bacterium]|nr:queuosine precursor transporter [Clostridia bacterium]
MRKTERNLILLNTIFVTSLVISNVISSKIVAIGSLTVPAAVVAYPITFLMTDVIGEIWGKKEAGNTVRAGVICQLLSLALIGLGLILPVAPFADNQTEYVAILGSSFRVVAASMVAYLCSQTWDVWVFHRIRDWYIRKHGSIDGGRWLWNNASTMSSQLIDTAVFIALAFYGTVPDITNMILSQYLVKLIYAALDTIPFYLLTNRLREEAIA